MHRYIARAIASLLLSVALSVLVAFTATGGKRRIEIRTDAKTGDIVTAVEALGRTDITLKVVDDPWVRAPAIGVVLASLGMGAMLWLSCGIVLFVEARIMDRFSIK